MAAMSYLRMAIAPTTRKTYDVGIAAFRQWREERGQAPDGLPTTNEIGCWLADCADKGGQRASTLRVYASAVSTWFAEMRHPDSREPNPAADPSIQRVLKGIQRQEVQRAVASVRRGRQKTADASELLLPTLLKFHFGESPRDCMFFAAACLAVTGGMRASELLGSKDYPERALTRDQQSFFAGTADNLAPIEAPHGGAAAPEVTPVVLEVHLHVTKTTQMSGVTKVIAAPRVVAAVWRWICVSAEHAAGDLLFQLEGRAPLTTGALTKDLERRHAAAGLGQVRYTGKSWRRGGAATLAALGYDAAAIAALGWAEDSAMWERYVRDPQVRRVRAVVRGGLMEPGRNQGEAAVADRR